MTLGAEVVQTFERHVWMTDPEGNDFCVTNEKPQLLKPGGP